MDLDLILHSLARPVIPEEDPALQVLRLLVVGVCGRPVHTLRRCLGPRLILFVTGAGQVEVDHLEVPAVLLPLLGLVCPLEDGHHSVGRKRVGTDGSPAWYPREAPPSTGDRLVPVTLLQGVRATRPGSCP